MNQSLLTTGTKVEFFLQGAAGENAHGPFAGELAGGAGEMEVAVRAAWRVLSEVSLSKSAWIAVSFSHPLHGMLRFEGDIRRVRRNGSEALLDIAIDERYREIQKRRYFRPACFVRAEYRPLDGDGKAACETFYTGVTRNVSMSGVCLMPDAPVRARPGGEIELALWLRGKTKITMRCRVVRVMDYGTGGRQSGELGVEIQEIAEDDAALLREYITKNAAVFSLYWGEMPSLYE